MALMCEQLLTLNLKFTKMREHDKLLAQSILDPASHEWVGELCCPTQEANF